ncbi:MAG: hypothetical protein ACP5D1_03735 [Bacteroidales bacterium]
MDAPVKDQEEWIFLEAFRHMSQGFPSGRIIKSESPDFILRHSRRYAIGIEITRLTGSYATHDYFQPGPHHEEEKGILQEACSLFETKHGISLYVQAGFRNDACHRSGSAQNKAALLAEWVGERIKEINGGTEYSLIEQQPVDLPFLDHIRVLYIPGLRFSNWSIHDEPDTGEWIPGLIEQTIQRKTHKLSLYRKRRLNQYWLIMVTSTTEGLPKFNLQDHLDQRQWFTGFQQVFLFELFPPKITPVFS